MLTQGEDVEAHALKERGWSISAIARHLERDRKTVRSYLSGEREPGVRVTVVVDPLAEFEGYIRARFVDDPHLWATSLFDEVVALVSSASLRERAEYAERCTINQPTLQ
jgi:transposase